MNSNKKIIMFAIFVLAFISLFSAIAYAKPFVEVFKNGLIQINDYFAKEQYKPYSKTIDFFVFAMLFTAIYLRGVKFAFKEAGRPEKMIAILLGFTTAFLLVLKDYSITSLLPFVNWLLFFLLFVLIWWLLKDLRSKFWRFVLALLLTLLLIFLAQLLFEGFTPPDTSGVSISNGGCLKTASTIVHPLLLLLIYILIFSILWFLFSGIKNHARRFLLALIFTLLLILLLHGIFGGFIALDFSNCFGTFGGEFGRFDLSVPQFGSSTLNGLKIPSVPTIPPVDQGKEPSKDSTKSTSSRPLRNIGTGDLKNMLNDPKATQTAKDRIQEELKFRESETQPAQQPAGSQLAPDATSQSSARAQAAPPPPPPSKGTYWTKIAIAVALFLALTGGGILFLRKRKGRGGGGGVNPNQYELSRSHYLSAKLGSVIKEKESTIKNIEELQAIKNNLIKSEENKQKLLEDLAKPSAANLGTNEGRRLIGQEASILHDLLSAEEGIRDKLKLLMDIENVLLTYMNRLQRFIPPEILLRLKNLIKPEPASNELRAMGIVHLISAYNHDEKKDEASLKELESLMQQGKIGELMQGKFKLVKGDWKNLQGFNEHEKLVVALLESKVKKQNQILGELIKMLLKNKRESSPKTIEAKNNIPQERKAA